MRFREYVLQKRRITDTPAGDFTGDCRDDSASFPDASTWKEVSDYLKTRNACDAAVEAGYDVWLQYERYVKRNKLK